MGLVTPRPVGITATFIGYLVAGLAGALIATLAIFTQSTLGSSYAPGRWFVRYRDSRPIKAFVKDAARRSGRGPSPGRSSRLPARPSPTSSPPRSPLSHSACSCGANSASLSSPVSAPSPENLLHGARRLGSGRPPRWVIPRAQGEALSVGGGYGRAARSRTAGGRVPPATSAMVTDPRIVDMDERTASQTSRSGSAAPG